MPPGNGLPSVTIHYAQTLDGRIATRGGESRWISGEGTLAFAHRLRATHDAILVGVGTVLRDDPHLTVRLAEGADPLRVVVDSALRTPPVANVLRDGAAAGTVLATTERALADRLAAMRALGARVLVGRADGEGHVDLADLLARLGSLGVSSLLVEGGAGIITAFLRASLVDRFVVCIAPKVLGRGIEGVGDLGIAHLAGALALADVQVERVGDDLVVDARLGAAKRPSAKRQAPGARAVWFSAPRAVEVRDEALPAVGAVEVRVRAELSAVSHGTEMLVYRGLVAPQTALDLPTLRGSFAFPIKYGYASVGRVVEAGAAVAGLQVGDRVFALHPHQSEYVVPAASLVRLPVGLPPEAGVFAANVETALNVLLDAPPRLGETWYDRLGASLTDRRPAASGRNGGRLRPGRDRAATDTVAVPLRRRAHHRRRRLSAAAGVGQAARRRRRPCS